MGIWASLTGRREPSEELRSQFPPAILEQLEPRLMLSAAYEVWGGTTDYRGLPNEAESYYNIDQQDYTLLGTSDLQNAPTNFTGNYDFYVLATRAQVQVDTFEGSDSSYYTGPQNTGNTEDWGNVDDLDGAYATVGWLSYGSDYQFSDTFAGYVVLESPGNWTSITVHTGEVNPAMYVSIDQQVEYQGVSTPSEYEFWFQVRDAGYGFIESARFQAPSAQWYDLVHEDEGYSYSQWRYGNDLFSSVGDMEAEFATGTYVLEIGSTLGNVTTEFYYGNPDTLAPIPRPTQVPVAVFPTMGMGGVTTNPTFQWSPVVDPNVNGIGTQVDDSDWESVFSESINSTRTTWTPGALSAATNYEWGLSFFNHFYRRNADYYWFGVQRQVRQSTCFRTGGGAPVWPDLTVDSVTYDAGAYWPLDELDLTAQISNVGEGNAIAFDGFGNSVPFYNDIILSTDQVYGNADDVLLYRMSDTPWLGGEQGGGSTPFQGGGMPQIPEGTAWGDYYLGFVVDADGQIDEPNGGEANNVWWSAVADIGVGPAIEGYVFDFSTAAPLENVLVDVYQGPDPDYAGENAWDWVTNAWTDATGRYEVVGIDLGGLGSWNYRLSINDGQQVAGRTYINASLPDVVVFDGATTTNMDFNLRRAAHIYGYVYDELGVPIDNAEVAVDADYTENYSQSWHKTLTDATGRYEIYLAPTDTAIYPVEMLSASDTTDTIHYSAEIAPGLYPASLSGTQGPDFHLLEGGVLHGLVINEAGDPIPNAGSNAFTDNNGEFWIEGVPAGIDVWLETDPWVWSGFEVAGTRYAWGERWIGPYNVDAGQELDIGTVTVLEAGTVRGVVTDVNGNPIVGAGVELSGKDVFGGYVDFGHGSTTDALGQYSYQWVPPGEYFLRGMKDGWLHNQSDEMLHLESGQEIVRDIVLTPSNEGVRVTGSISNFAQIAPRNGNGTVLPFELIEYDDYGLPDELGVMSWARDTTLMISDPMGLDRLFTAWGFIEDGYGDYFAPSANPGGTFEMVLPAGVQEIIAHRDSQTDALGWQSLVSNPILVNGQPGQQIDNLQLSIPIGDGTVRGTVTFPAGHPGITAEEVSARFLLRTAGSDSVFGRAVGEPGPSGEYALHEIPAGTYQLFAVAEGVAPWMSQPFTLGDGQTVFRDIAFTYGAVASGVVSSGGVPVEGAIVASAAIGHRAVTDSAGAYWLGGLLAGNDELTVTSPGFAAQSVSVALVNGVEEIVDFDLAGNTASLTGTIRNTDRLTDGVDNDGDGQIDEAGEDLIGGATVVAYNTGLGKSVSVQTVAGVFVFQSLIPGDYVIAAHMPGLATTLYPGGAGTLTLAPSANVDLAGLTPDHIELNYTQPQFSITGTVGASVLSMTFYSDVDLNTAPAVTLIEGGGALGALIVANGAFTCDYAIGGGDQIVRVRIDENTGNPVIPGSPSSRVFRFDMAGGLLEFAGTTFYNAEGAAVAIMGSQVVAAVYVPPFALVGNDATQALTLTASRYGQPGGPMGTDRQAISSIYDFSFGDDGELADVQVDHQATITLRFTMPDGMTPDGFMATLAIGFFNEAAGEWVWNDMANSNPASNISDISINWLTNTITFKASHFTKFVAALEGDVVTFVTRFYQHVLGRQPDPEGLANWVDDLMAGTRTGAEVAAGFMFSAEYTNQGNSDEQFVDTSYRAFFDRDADAPGKANWVGDLVYGTLREDVLKGFVYSLEFTNLAGQYGIQSYSQEDLDDYQQTNPVRQFVTRFYVEVLGRKSDAAGLGVWVADLLAQTHVGADVAFGFMFSQEYLNQNTSNDEFVTTSYAAFFDRDPDAGGKANWLAAMADGASRVDVLKGFTDSIEFANLCDLYGILPNLA